MPYQFFFSYSRANNDAYLRFFEDLSKEVRNLRGLAADVAVGFFDQRAIELGDDWDDSLVQALNGSRVMLALGSPAYFKSDYCGREWALFRQRCRAAAAPGAKPPPLLKTVLWYETVIDGLPADSARIEELRRTLAALLKSSALPGAEKVSVGGVSEMRYFFEADRAFAQQVTQGAGSALAKQGVNLRLPTTFRDAKAFPGANQGTVELWLPALDDVQPSRGIRTY